MELRSHIRLAIMEIDRMCEQTAARGYQINDGIGYIAEGSAVPPSSVSVGKLNRSNSVPQREETESEPDPIWYVLNNNEGNHTSKCKPCRKYFQKRFQGDQSILQKTIVVKCLKTREKSDSIDVRHSRRKRKGKYSQLVEETRGGDLSTSTFSKRVKRSTDDKNQHEFSLDSAAKFETKAVSSDRVADICIQSDKFPEKRCQLHVELNRFNNEKVDVEKIDQTDNPSPIDLSSKPTSDVIETNKFDIETGNELLVVELVSLIPDQMAVETFPQYNVPQLYPMDLRVNAVNSAEVFTDNLPHVIVRMDPKPMPEPIDAKANINKGKAMKDNTFSDIPIHICSVDGSNDSNYHRNCGNNDKVADNLVQTDMAVQTIPLDLCRKHLNSADIFPQIPVQMEAEPIPEPGVSKSDVYKGNNEVFVKAIKGHTLSEIAIHISSLGGSDECNHDRNGGNNDKDVDNLVQAEITVVECNVIEANALDLCRNDVTSAEIVTENLPQIPVQKEPEPIPALGVSNSNTYKGNHKKVVGETMKDHTLPETVIHVSSVGGSNECSHHRYGGNDDILADNLVQVESIHPSIVDEPKEMSTLGSFRKASTSNIPTDEVELLLGCMGAVNPYENHPSTCRLLSKKQEQLLSNIDDDEKKQSKRPRYQEGSSNQNICSDTEDILNNTYAIVQNTEFRPRNPRKNDYELKIFECEDEMFELDMEIRAAQSAFEKLKRIYERLIGMTRAERNSFSLLDNIEGSFVCKKALQRLFGDKCAEFFNHLTLNPFSCIPFALNLISEQIVELNSKKKKTGIQFYEVLLECYPKSLDHQGKKFRELDRKYVSIKHLDEEIEDIYKLREETNTENSNDKQNQAHLVLIYKDREVLNDAADLIYHYVKSHYRFDNEDKTYAEHIIFHVVPDIFAWKRQNACDIKNDYEDPFGCDIENSIIQSVHCPNSSPPKDKNENLVSEPDTFQQNYDIAYTLFFGSNCWYLFLRLHHILCSRLDKLHEICLALPEEEDDDKPVRYIYGKALTINSRGNISNKEKYENFLEDIKKFLDGAIDYDMYEERLREIFGINAYIGYSMDTIISNAVDQILKIASNKIDRQCIKLMYQQGYNGGSGGLCHTLLQRKDAELLHETMAREALTEMKLYKIILYHESEMKLIIKLLEMPHKQIKCANRKKKQSRKTI